MSFYQCPYCGYRGNPTYYKVTYQEHLQKCRRNPQNVTICFYCNKKLKKNEIKLHRSLCGKAKGETYNECTYCGKLLSDENLKNHLEYCDRNPSKINFDKEDSKNSISTINPIFIPLSQHTIQSSHKCRVCEENFAMASSDICYQCKDK